jgi:hypothetical protein
MEWTTLEQLAPSVRRGGTIALGASITAWAASSVMSVDVAVPGLLVWFPAIMAGWVLRAAPVPSSIWTTVWRAGHAIAGCLSIGFAVADLRGGTTPLDAWLFATVVLAGYLAGRSGLVA